MTREQIIELAKDCHVLAGYEGEWQPLIDFFHAAQRLGAEQERARWLKENAPGGWIDDLRKQAQQTTEPELPDDEPSDAEWDKVDPAFTEWWNAEYDDTTNPFRIDSLAYWAWAGWKAAGVRAGMGVGQSQDAKRWQFFRKKAPTLIFANDGRDVELVDLQLHAPMPFDEHQLDAAIDAAMKGGQHE